MYNFRRVTLLFDIITTVTGGIVAPEHAPGKTAAEIVRERSS
jgi:hypothetical protein